MVTFHIERGMPVTDSSGRLVIEGQAEEIADEGA